MEYLTIESLSSLEPGIFLHGTTTMEEFPLIPIKWVATRGIINDWAIYYGSEEKTLLEIKYYGKKLYSKTKIRELCPCDDKSFERYRF